MHAAEVDPEELVLRSQPAARTCAGHAIRRLDWRFLLPEPRLERVAYFGSGDGSLLKALKEFSRSLTIPSLGRPEHSQVADEGAFDLVVVQSRSRRVVEQAGAMVAPHGYLFWELERAGWHRSARGPATAVVADETLWGCWFRDNTRIVEELGFREIVSHWHYPDFTTCRQIIPLTDSAAVEQLLTRWWEPVPPIVALQVSRFATKTGILNRFAPYVSIVARKEQGFAMAP